MSPIRLPRTFVLLCFAAATAAFQAPWIPALAPGAAASALSSAASTGGFVRRMFFNCGA